MKKILCTLTVLFALLAVVTGPAVAQDQPTHLYGYLLGSAPPGWADVSKALDAKLTKDLNATMEMNWIGWNDTQTKYPLILASGENVDWVYAASWQLYAQQAVKGAFLELTEDMLKKYMPKHYAAVGPAGWSQAKINGKIYMIPTSSPDKKMSVIIIRGDLRKKYGVPPVKKATDLEAYLAAIKKNEPSMIPMNLDGGYDIGQPWTALAGQLSPAAFTGLPNSPFAYNYELAKPVSEVLFQGVYAKASRDASVILKRWYDAGYINKNPFANKVRSKDSFEQGKSAVAFGNSQDTQGTLAKATDLGYQPEVLLVGVGPKGTYAADPYIGNGAALSAATKNVEKTLKFLDLIMEDPAYNYLVYFGIEGKNYVVTADGKIGLPAGLTADKNDYPPDAAGFWFTDKNQFKPLASWSDTFIAQQKEIATRLVNSPVATFELAPDKVKTELANVNQTWIQYSQPLQVGAVPDVDKAIAILNQKLDAANLKVVRAELDAQLKVHLATH